MTGSISWLAPEVLLAVGERADDSMSPWAFAALVGAGMLVVGVLLLLWGTTRNPAGRRGWRRRRQRGPTGWGTPEPVPEVRATVPLPWQTVKPRAEDALAATPPVTAAPPVAPQAPPPAVPQAPPPAAPQHAPPPVAPPAAPQQAPPPVAPQQAPPPVARPPAPHAPPPVPRVAPSGPLAPPAGWYPDPGEPSRARWWGGDAWTEHVR